MNILSEDPIKLHPEAAHDAAERLEAALASDPTLAQAVPETILRLVPGKRAVFSGTLNGTPAVFRIYLDAKGPQTAQNEWAEITRAATYMQDGPYRVAPPLGQIADQGVIVTGQATGTPLLEHLWSLPQDDRITLIPHAAGWLRQFTQPTETWKTANRGPWRTWAEEATARQPHKRLQSVESGILAKMKQLGRKFKGAEWRVAISHGDFHPNNLLVDGPTLTGIDLGGSTPMPIYKDIARFLVHSARRAMIPSGTRHFGVCKVSFDAFANAFDMTETERDYCLPFMIAFETLVRVEHKRMPATRIRLAREMSDAMFEDLKQAAKA